MKKQVRALLEIAIIYVAVSIVLDSVLGGFQILLLPALACAFVLFATMIFGVLWEQRVPTPARNTHGSPTDESDLIRLGRLCNAAIGQGEAKAGEAISERIRSIAFAAAAYHLNEPEATLRTMAEQEPALLHPKIGDENIFRALTTSGSITRKGNWQGLDECLRRIEDWAK